MVGLLVILRRSRVQDLYKLVWVKAVVEGVFEALKEDVEQSKAVVVYVVVCAVYHHFVEMVGILATLVTKEGADVAKNV